MTIDSALWTDVEERTQISIYVSSEPIGDVWGGPPANHPVLPMRSAQEPIDGVYAPVSPPDTASEAVDELIGATVLDQLPEQGFRLRRSLPLMLHRAPNYYWVAPMGFVLHGVGDTPTAAIEDYANALLDYYEDLRDRREILAPHLLEHLEFLEDLIAEV